MNDNKGLAKVEGQIGLKVIRSNNKFLKQALPERGLPDEINKWRRSNAAWLLKPYAKIQVARVLNIPTYYGVLDLTRYRPLVPDRILPELLQEWAATALLQMDFPAFVRRKGFSVESFHFATASLKSVTTAGVGFIVDAFQNLTELENLKFHGIGTGTNAEAVGDTALQTELTTQYNPDNTRATGSTTEGAANVYRTVGTNTVDAVVSITEHMILSQAATGGGTGLDRSVFTAVGLASGDSLQSTYDATFASGG